MDKEQQQRLDRKAEELMDRTKVNVYCGDHMYFGPGKNRDLKPHKGCKKCWFVYYLYDIANTDPGQRYERLRELQEVLHHVVESVERGEFDFTPFERAEFIEEQN